MQISDGKPYKVRRHLLSVWLVNSEYGASPLLSAIFGCVGKLVTPSGCKPDAHHLCTVGRVVMQQIANLF